MADTPTRHPWHRSLIARIIVLCTILMLCMFAAVWYFSTQYYVQTVAHMENRARDIAEEARLILNEEIRTTGDLPESIIVDDVEMGQFQPDPNVSETTDPRLEAQKDRFAFMATQIIELEDGRTVGIAMEINLDPQTEIVRAFQNEFLLSVTIVFLLTLCALVWVIWRALRPLQELSESIEGIGKGELRNVTARGTASEIVALEETFNSMVASLKEKEVVESKLRQAQRLSAIGNLAAGVAHDVRNPLNAIKLLSSHALDNLGDENDKTAKQLTTIRNEVNRLEDIVSSFLSLAKEEELHFESVAVDGILEECLRLVKKDAEMRQVSLVSELRVGEVTLQLDARKISRAVLNVLINAMEACPEGGRVRLFSRVLNEECQIEVRDDGPGLSDDALERVFEPYFTTKAMGTGLGLSITRGIIEEHRGTISITSSEGAGTQVLIALPMAPE